MPDFGISTGISRFGAQSLPANPFGTPSLDALVKGGTAFASTENSFGTNCYELFVAEIRKTKLEASGEEQDPPDPQAWGVNPKMSPTVQKINWLLGKAGTKIRINSHIYKICWCQKESGWKGVSTVYALINHLGNLEGFRYDPWTPFLPSDSCISKPSSYKCLSVFQPCGRSPHLYECGRSTPTAEQLKKNPKTVKVCPCNDMKEINLAGVTSNTKEYTTSNGTKITLKNPGNFEKVMEQIVEEEKKIKLKCTGVWVADHPAKKPPEER